MLLAPTGKAAFNIKGNTIHSAFAIPASQSLKIKSKRYRQSLKTSKPLFTEKEQGTKQTA